MKHFNGRQNISAKAFKKTNAIRYFFETRIIIICKHSERASKTNKTLGKQYDESNILEREFDHTRLKEHLCKISSISCMRKIRWNVFPTPDWTDKENVWKINGIDDTKYEGINSYWTEYTDRTRISSSNGRNMTPVAFSHSIAFLAGDTIMLVAGRTYWSAKYVLMLLWWSLLVAVEWLEDRVSSPRVTCAVQFTLMYRLQWKQ